MQLIFLGSTRSGIKPGALDGQPLQPPLTQCLGPAEVDLPRHAPRRDRELDRADQPPPTTPSPPGPNNPHPERSHHDHADRSSRRNDCHGSCSSPYDTKTFWVAERLLDTSTTHRGALIPLQVRPCRVVARSRPTAWAFTPDEGTGGRPPRRMSYAQLEPCPDTTPSHPPPAPPA